jgi:hypothetical protein
VQGSHINGRGLNSSRYPDSKERKYSIAYGLNILLPSFVECSLVPGVDRWNGGVTRRWSKADYSDLEKFLLSCMYDVPDSNLKSNI